MSLEIKNFIFKFGPCQPLQEDLSNKMFPYDTTKKEKRSFNDTNYFRILTDKSRCQRDWLSYSLSLNTMFYIHCMLFGTNLYSNLEKSWTKDDFNNWNSFAIQMRELISDHVTLSLKFKLRQQNVSISKSF